MRKSLKERYGRRGKFSAIFKRHGVYRGFQGHHVPTALFIDVKDESGQVVTDHIWFNVGKYIHELALQPGDEVFFVARVTKYWKRNPEAAYDDDAPVRVQDYRLSWPTKMRKLGAAPEMPLFDDPRRETEI